MSQALFSPTLFAIPLEAKNERFAPTAPQKRIIIISGPTACGKSELALSLAEKLQGEIISADSMQVYRRMNIGTAKPTLEEQLRVPHHLIDLKEVHEGFNVVQFVHEAEKAIDSIHSRNKIPIFVGGTGFYIHALLFGLPEGPPPNAEIRLQLELEIVEKGADELYLRLQGLDPLYASTITPHDRHKLVRALEIILLSGKPVSAFNWNLPKKPLYNARCWFFNRPRESLYRRIEKRCHLMLESGLIDETQALIPLGIEKNSSACQAIGYRQVLEYLATEQSRIDYKKLEEDFKRATRHYAKRQITWFRKEPAFKWLDLDLHDPETILDIILRDFEYWLWEL